MRRARVTIAPAITLMPPVAMMTNMVRWHGNRIRSLQVDPDAGVDAVKSGVDAV